MRLQWVVRAVVWEGERRRIGDGSVRRESANEESLVSNWGVDVFWLFTLMLGPVVLRKERAGRGRRCHRRGRQQGKRRKFHPMINKFLPLSFQLPLHSTLSTTLSTTRLYPHTTMQKTVMRPPASSRPAASHAPHVHFPTPTRSSQVQRSEYAALRARVLAREGKGNGDYVPPGTRTVSLADDMSRPDELLRGVASTMRTVNAVAPGSISADQKGRIAARSGRGGRRGKGGGGGGKASGRSRNANGRRGGGGGIGNGKGKGIGKGVAKRHKIKEVVETRPAGYRSKGGGGGGRRKKKASRPLPRGRERKEREQIEERRAREFRARPVPKISGPDGTPVSHRGPTRGSGSQRKNNRRRGGGGGGGGGYDEVYDGRGGARRGNGGGGGRLHGPPSFDRPEAPNHDQFLNQSFEREGALLDDSADSDF